MVKRYYLSTNSEEYTMIEDSCGDYVRYEDYKALEDKIREALAVVDGLYADMAGEDY